MTTPSGLPIRALQYWGVASGAVAARATTAEVWAAINAAAQANGQESAGLTLGDFNKLRSAAAGVRNASEYLAQGNPESVIEDAMIGSPPWARPLSEQNAAPMFQARFLHTTADDEGNESADWRTVTFSSGLPPTLDAFHTALQQDAEALADKYNSQHVDVDSITIMRV